MHQRSPSEHVNMHAPLPRQFPQFLGRRSFVQRFEGRQLFLEFDTPRAGNFAPLRYLPKDKKLILGLVTTKSGELEKADDLKRRIDEASQLVPLDQLGISPQCGFSSTVLGNQLTIDDQIAKLKLVVRVAKDVWG